MSNIIDGKQLSSKIEDELKQSIKGCIIRPSVAVIEIGDNPKTDMFIKLKEEACNKIGIYFRHYKFEDNTPELTIINKIKELNNDDYVNGIMVQVPIPERYNSKRILNTIINSKDIDGLTDINIGRFISGRKTIIPCAALAIMTLLEENNIDLDSKHVVLVGKGKSVGRPLLTALLNEGATVTVCHSRTENIKKYTTLGDIVISATGTRGLINENMVKDGAIVIDAGCTILDGEVLGDVEIDKVSKKASLVIPSKDGVMPVVVAMFLKNTLLCYNNKK